MKRNAFTLVELIVVVAIVMILAAILFPVFRQPHHSGSRTSCQSNLKQMGLGFMMYVQDYSEKFPPVTSGQDKGWVDSIHPYIKRWQTFQCPTATGNQPNTTDYFYNGRLSRVAAKNVFNPSQTLLAGDGQDDSATRHSIMSLPPAWLQQEKSPTKRHLDGANYAFADGHVKWLKPGKIENGAPAGESPYNPTFAFR